MRSGTANGKEKKESGFISREMISMALHHLSAWTPAPLHLYLLSAPASMPLIDSPLGIKICML